MSLMERLLIDAGLKVVAADPGRQQGAGDFLPAQPTIYTQMQAIWGELIEIGMQTDDRTWVMNKDRRRKITDADKRRDMERRFLRDPRKPNAPLVVRAKFFPEPATRWDKKSSKHLLMPGIGQAINAKIRVPDRDGGQVEVEAVPHIVVNGIGGVIPYCDLEPTEDGIVIHGREHDCMVIAPLNPDKQPYRLIPLGLASASRCEMWNRVVEGLPNRNLSKIEPIPHNLLGHGAGRYLVFTPPGVFVFDGEEKRADDERQYHYGHVWGQSAVIVMSKGRRTQIAPFDDDENCTYTDPIVFGVTLHERSIGLRYFRKAGTGGMIEGKMDIGSAPVVNPFEALGNSVMSAHPHVSAGKAYALARGNHNHDNPLYAYGAKHGYIDPTSPDDPRITLNRLAGIVVEALRRHLNEAKDKVVRELHYGTLPELAEVLAGQNADEVWNRMDSKDFLADWIAERVTGKSFDWSAWLHRAVRTELLREIFVKAGVEPPKRQERRQRPPVTEEPTPPADPAPPAEPQPPAEPAPTNGEAETPPARVRRQRPSRAKIKPTGDPASS